MSACWKSDESTETDQRAGVKGSYVPDPRTPIDAEHGRRRSSRGRLRAQVPRGGTGLARGSGSRPRRRASAGEPMIAELVWDMVGDQRGAVFVEECFDDLIAAAFASARCERPCRRSPTQRAPLPRTMVDPDEGGLGTTTWVTRTSRCSGDRFGVSGWGATIEPLVMPLDQVVDVVLADTVTRSWSGSSRHRPRANRRGDALTARLERLPRSEQRGRGSGENTPLHREDFLPVPPCPNATARPR